MVISRPLLENQREQRLGVALRRKGDPDLVQLVDLDAGPQQLLLQCRLAAGQMEVVEGRMDCAGDDGGLQRRRQKIEDRRPASLRRQLRIRRIRRIRRQDIDQPRPVLGNRVAQSGGKDRGILSDHHERARFVRGKVFREREHAANQYCVPPVSVMPVIPEMPPWPTQFPENRLPTKRPLRSLATSRVADFQRNSGQSRCGHNSRC